MVKYGIEHQALSQADFDSARKKLLAELALDDEAQLLGMACRLVEQKGVSYALEAIRDIHSDYPNAHLVIAGDGELMHELKHVAAEYEISDNVHFLGWRADVPQLMAGFDIFLMPSLWEGFGLVAVEAMASGVPGVCSSKGAQEDRRV